MKIFYWLALSLIITSCANVQPPVNVTRLPFQWEDSSIIFGFYLNDSCYNDTVINVHVDNITGKVNLKTNNEIITSISGDFTGDSILYDDLKHYYNRVFYARKLDSTWNYYTFQLKGNELGELYLWRLDSNMVRVQANVVNYL